MLRVIMGTSLLAFFQQQQMPRYRPSKARPPVLPPWALIGLLIVSSLTPLLLLVGCCAHMAPPCPKAFIDSSANISGDYMKLAFLQDRLFSKEVLDVTGVRPDKIKGISSSQVLENRDAAFIKSIDPFQFQKRKALEALDHSIFGKVDVLNQDQSLTDSEACRAGADASAFSRRQVRIHIGRSAFKKYNLWRKEKHEQDALVKLLHDQIIMGRVYMTLASSQDDIDLLHDLNSRIKENQRVLGESSIDADLPRSASEKIKAMGQVLSKARGQLYDCKLITRKLRAMLQGTEDQTRVLNKQSAVLKHLVAKTLPKSLHCLSMLLMTEYNSLPDDQREFGGQENLEDPSLFHYALFSDNVIAVAVVVNSTISNAKEPEKHVFHLVTDKLNYPAMKMWFLLNPPGNATITVQSIDDFKWLNASYCPVLRQFQTPSMRGYYFKADQPNTHADAVINLKYRNPKYLSVLNHLRFYLPEIYPKLDKIVFLDDDVVVQKDLTPLWSIHLGGNVNGAVETCGETFHRFDNYLNFSNPLISASFDPNDCGWAFGMNIFDLQQWRVRDATGIYHKWQILNERRELWKLGTLPPGLITFYNMTYPLEQEWHVLGLGYDPNVDLDDITKAAVVHYNGNMKPWLELAMVKYKMLWAKYLDYNHPFLQQCNVNM